MDFTYGMKRQLEKKNCCVLRVDSVAAGKGRINGQLQMQKNLFNILGDFHKAIVATVRALE